MFSGERYPALGTACSFAADTRGPVGIAGSSAAGLSVCTQPCVSHGDAVLPLRSSRCLLVCTQNFSICYSF